MFSLKFIFFYLVGALSMLHRSQSAPVNCNLYRLAKRTFFSSKNENGVPYGTNKNFVLDAYAHCKGKQSSFRSSKSRPTCGEDSYFIQNDRIGVADGVGGWNDVGVDPSVISRSLMKYASNIAIQEASPATILKLAYESMLRDSKVKAGSTTACVLALNEDDCQSPVLEYSNLGDSGFVVIRNNIIVFHSTSQYVGNAPYQLAKLSEELKNKGYMEVPVHMADSGQLVLEDGDLIILATDGVWDNYHPNYLSESEDSNFLPIALLRELRLHSLLDIVSKGKTTKDIAEGIVNGALRNNLKPDDITVIVAQVKKLSK